MTGLPDAERPATVVFEVATARRAGAQPRYNGGVRLAEVRAAYAMLGRIRQPPARRGPRRGRCHSGCSRS
ncbi:hypothetical protein [Micromonospora luteifusca]|uniref:hypothetical protein n=1 Tax=Micromonospora luteifusca TaxID=709860 RepID=UPI0033B9E46F